MVHPLLHKTHNNNNGTVLILGKMCICIDCLFRTGIWSGAICKESIVLTSVSLSVISFDMITRTIIGLSCFAGFIFAP